jgi:hypothetical protein
MGWGIKEFTTGISRGYEQRYFVSTSNKKYGRHSPLWQCTNMQSQSDQKRMPIRHAQVGARRDLKSQTDYTTTGGLKMQNMECNHRSFCSVLGTMLDPGTPHSCNQPERHTTTCILPEVKAKYGVMRPKSVVKTMKPERKAHHTWNPQLPHRHPCLKYIFAMRANSLRDEIHMEGRRTGKHGPTPLHLLRDLCLLQ